MLAAATLLEHGTDSQKKNSCAPHPQRGQKPWCQFFSSRGSARTSPAHHARKDLKGDFWIVKWTEV